jgi:hypothetical protein
VKTCSCRSSATAARLGAAVDGHESLELAADELLLALVELDLALRLRCLVRCGDEADPLGLELGLAPPALPLLTLVLRSAHAVPPFRVRVDTGSAPGPGAMRLRLKHEHVALACLPGPGPKSGPREDVGFARRLARCLIDANHGERSAVENSWELGALPRSLVSQQEHINRKEPEVAGKKRPKSPGQTGTKAPAKPKRPKKTSRGK